MSALSSLPTHLKWALATISGCLNGAALPYGPLAFIANHPFFCCIRR